MFEHAPKRQIKNYDNKVILNNERNKFQELFQSQYKLNLEENKKFIENNNEIIDKLSLMLEEMQNIFKEQEKHV
jgi:hypothetical protein